MIFGQSIWSFGYDTCSSAITFHLEITENALSISFQTQGDSLIKGNITTGQCRAQNMKINLEITEIDLSNSFYKQGDLL